MTRRLRSDRQLALPVSAFGSLTTREQLRAAYERCHGLRRTCTFEKALGEPVLAKCLRGMARAMARAEAEGRRFGHGSDGR